MMRFKLFLEVVAVVMLVLATLVLSIMSYKGFIENNQNILNRVVVLSSELSVTKIERDQLKEELEKERAVGQKPMLDFSSGGTQFHPKLGPALQWIAVAEKEYCFRENAVVVKEDKVGQMQQLATLPEEFWFGRVYGGNVVTILDSSRERIVALLIISSRDSPTDWEIVHCQK